MISQLLSRHFSERLSGRDSGGVRLTSAQISIDAMTGSFVDQATDPKMLAAMLGAGLAYRVTRIATLSAASSLMNQGRGLLPFLMQGSSYATALAIESLAFTAIHRSFNFHSDENFGKEWLHSTITLGSLKFFGSFAERQNIIFQHFFTDVGMLASHHLAALADLEEKSNESLCAQFIHAESMNWQMKAGMALAYTLMPSFSYLEKSLDFTLKSQTQGRRSTLMDAERGGILASELPVMNSVESFADRVDRYRRRAHHSMSPLLTGTVIDAVTRAQVRAKKSQRVPFVSDVRRKWLEMLSDSLRVKAETLGRGYGVVFLPGMYNHPPDPAWMNLTSAAFEHGGAVMSTAVSGAMRGEAHELYSMIGENSRVLQPHWEMEIPIVIRRLAIALRDSRILGSAEKLVFIGHSKGGLLAHALKVLQKVYEENGGSIPQKFQDLYPGLEHVNSADLNEVMEVLKKSKVVLLASPIEGIDYNLLIELADHFLLEGSAQGFDQERLLSYFEALGVGPELADLIVHSQMPGLLRSLIQISHPGNTLDGLAYRAVGLFFYGISFVMRARDGDALIRTSKRYTTKLLRRSYNHVDMIMDPSAAKDLLQLIFDYLEKNQD